MLYSYEADLGIVQFRVNLLPFCVWLVHSFFFTSLLSFRTKTKTEISICCKLSQPNINSDAVEQYYQAPSFLSGLDSDRVNHSIGKCDLKLSQKLGIMLSR